MDELVFVNLQPGQQLKLNDYIVKWDLPLPMLEAELDRTIKNKEIPWSSFIRGIVHVLALKPEFNHVGEYKKMLYAFDPKIEALLLQEGAQLAGEGNLETALVIFQGLTNLNPKLGEAWFNLGLCYQEKASKEESEGKASVEFCEKGIHAFEQANLQGTPMAEAYYNMGFLYRKIGRLSDAKDAWTEAIALGIDQNRKEELEVLTHEMDRVEIAEVQFESGVNALNKGNFKEASKLLKPLSIKYPHWWQAAFNLGLAYQNMGQYEDALQVFSNVAAVNPAMPEVHSQRALCLFSLGNLNEAESAMRDALVLRPEDSGFLCNLALIYRRQKRQSEAAELLYQALEKNPEDQLVKHYIEELPAEFKR
ncbi:MAG TPA: tetratricopeptide repeat protein [Bacillota bacterium]|nr:tetratricopeptide repeat protein [Bacillota bacterium]